MMSGGPVPQAFAGDHNESPGVAFDGVARLDIGGAVTADDLPIGATRQNAAGKLWSAHAAAENADHTALAIRRAAEICDGLKFGVNCENWLFAQHEQRSVGAPTCTAIAI